MQRLRLERPTDEPLRILCLGAHADDIEIGAGGAVLSLLERYPGASVQWVVFSANSQRSEEAEASAAAFLAGAGQSRVFVHQFRDAFFPDEFKSLKQTFEDLKRGFDPHLIFSHHGADGHQDHRVIAELTWNTFRDHLVLGYEILKYDPDLGNPNVFIPLEQRTAELKVAHLMRYFASQRTRRWFVPGTFEGIMRVRGVQAAAPSGFAEGFHAPKVCL
jgi:LmbE family N-acetylglucosaminyl deacetylase